MNRNLFPLSKKTLGQAAELIAVLLIGFGIFIYSSTQIFFENNISPIRQDYSSFDFYFIVAYEVIAFLLIIFILKKRKWTVQDFNLDFRANMLVIALLLIALRFITTSILNYILTSANLFNLELNAPPEINLNVSMFSVILMLFVNSFFEEMILIGYLFKRLEKFHVSIIILFSLLLRVSFHTYQGINEIPRILSLGLVLGLYYGRYKKLAPVILAHGIGNLFFFLNYEYKWIDF